MVQLTLKVVEVTVVNVTAVACTVGLAAITVAVTVIDFEVPLVVEWSIVAVYNPAGADALTRTYTVTGCAVSAVPVRGSVIVFEKVVVFNEISKLAGAVTITSAVKLLPLTVYDCDAEAVPVTVVIGFKALVDKLILATPAGSMVNIWALETAVPFATVTLAVPADVISVASTAAVSCVAETNVVTLLLPFHRTTLVPLTKPLPLTVSVKAPVPAIFDGGAIEVVIGTTTVTLTLS